MFKKKCRALPWKGTSLCPKTYWQPKDWKALWQKKIWVSWCTLSWARASKAPFQQERPAASWAAVGRASSAGWGSWFSPSSQPGEVHEECLVQSRASQDGQTWMDRRESNNGPQRLREWSTSRTSQVRMLHLFSLEERGFRGDLIYTSREGAKKVGNRLLSVVPKGWEAMGTKWNTRNSI